MLENLPLDLRYLVVASDELFHIHYDLVLKANILWLGDELVHLFEHLLHLFIEAGVFMSFRDQSYDVPALINQVLIFGPITLLRLIKLLLLKDSIDYSLHD